VVTIDQVLPYGLRVSELISNAFRLGFVDGHGGDLTFRLAPLTVSAHRRLCVSDTGGGAPDIGQASTFSRLPPPRTYLGLFTRILRST
jgi:two-component sensor histidine kinase